MVFVVQLIIAKLPGIYQKSGESRSPDERD
jgi:hypothetical protein